jgi:hypothetical protein
MQQEALAYEIAVLGHQLQESHARIFGADEEGQELPRYYLFLFYTGDRLIAGRCSRTHISSCFSVSR